jgi:hypothetical protein
LMGVPTFFISNCLFLHFPVLCPKAFQRPNDYGVCVKSTVPLTKNSFISVLIVRSLSIHNALDLFLPVFSTHCGLELVCKSMTKVGKPVLA